MPLAEIISQIQTLPKLDKLRLMQFLATELIKEEDANFFLANQEYPVWSPYNCSEAANVLMNILATKQRSRSGLTLKDFPTKLSQSWHGRSNAIFAFDT